MFIAEDRLSQELFDSIHKPTVIALAWTFRFGASCYKGVGATTECRATFEHSPNEPARLARQWMKERGIIVCTLSVGFIYLVARLARQWKNFYGVKC